MQNEKNVVLLTHLPPFGLGIDISKSNGAHIGSNTIKKILETMQPFLHICGHAHNSFGEEKIGKTISINIGAVKENRALLLELGNELKWKKILI